MVAPPRPQNEEERLGALLSYKILDSAPEKDFDEITRLASEICQTPMSVITLLDENRQWFKSKVGFDGKEGSRETSFCGHVINQPDKTFIVEDAREDERFHDNPDVNGGLNVRAYVGVPLVNPDGYALGTLCVFDNQVRRLNDFQIGALQTLANQAMKLLELRKSNFKLVESHNALLDRYKDLEQFSKVVTHDLTAPLNNIRALSQILKGEHKAKIDGEVQDMIGYIKQAASRLKTLVDGLLQHYKSDTMDIDKREKIRLREFTKYTIGLLEHTANVEFVLPDEKAYFWSNRLAFGQILSHLIANAVQYNDKEKPVIEIGFVKTSDENFIWVKDNGTGIQKQDFDKIFQMFSTLGKTGRLNEQGSGIGLATVQKLAAKLGGNVSVESQLNVGTTITVTLPK